MGTVACRPCKGQGSTYSKSGKKFTCNACNGSGINRDLWSATCSNCYDQITYRANTPTPRCCKKCAGIERTKTCEQMGCSNTIRYKLGWSNIPTYCKRCEAKQKQGFSASLCSGVGLFHCGTIIWSPPGKQFKLCPNCNERKRAADAAMWQEKKCPGLKGQSCGKTIRYRTDWDEAPKICPDCLKEAKKQKAEREAKRREKPCKRCGEKVTYYTDGKEFEYCKKCNDLRVQVVSNSKNFQAMSQGKVLFTFGRCSSPKQYATGQKESDETKQQKEWHQKGYWFLSIPGKMHETYIVTKEPVSKGFIVANWEDVIAMKTNPGTLLRGFSAITHAIINGDNYDL